MTSSTTPWRDAKPGELWVLTLDSGETRTAAASRGISTRPPGAMIFQGEGIGTLVTDHHIVGGFRVWPPAVDATRHWLAARVRAAAESVSPSYHHDSIDGKIAEALLILAGELESQTTD